MAFNLKEFAIGCGLHDPEGFVAGVDKLYELVIETNKTMNLTRIVEPEEFRIKHVADSLAIAREFPEFASEYLKVADIGCGAGFPSLVLAMAFPNLKVTPIDSTGKKAAFVDHTAQALGLRNVNVVNGRSCELNRRSRL